VTAAHDLVVVGASAGGVEALRQVMAALPADFKAAILVVLHVPPDVPSQLAPILRRAGALPVSPAVNRQLIEPGHVYVAPPNRHLLVEDGRLVLTAGPRENSARPAVDVLFRSAARAYGPRAIGVVLSGTLRDGALGLAAIKLHGGTAIVQDPDEALFSGMPESALAATGVDYCLPVAEIGVKLARLTTRLDRGEPPADPGEPPAWEVEEEGVQIGHAADEPGGEGSAKQADAASGLSCPECQGSLWALKGPGGARLECRVGHAYSMESFLTDQGEAVEAALWAAINALQERAAAYRRLGDGLPGGSGDYIARSRQVEGHAEALLELLRTLIVDVEGPPSAGTAMSS